MSDDISRRIDDLLSGAIDEQVREQRVLNDMMVGVRDGVSRLVGDLAAISARVTEARETSQGLREELPFLVQREVTTAVNSLSVRIDVLETAVGELVASLAGLEDRVGPDVIIGGVSQRLESLRSQEEEQAGAVTAEAARVTVEQAAENLRIIFEDEAGQVRATLEHVANTVTDIVEKHHGQIQKRLGETKKWADDLEGRMRALEKALEVNLKMPADVRKQLNELTGATQDMTDSVLEEVRINAEAAAGRITQSVEGLDREAGEMNRRFAEMNDRLAAFQEQILAYLQVRDVALEERRDQIVTELLADFLNELPERERERTVGRLRSVFARRRDRRDADRFRSGAKASPLPPVSPQAIERAQIEMQREQRLAERPWAERSWVEEAPQQPAPVEPEPAYESFDYAEPEPEAEMAPVEPARPAARIPRAPAARKSGAARKPPAKKKAAAARKPAAKKAAKPKPVEVEPEETGPLAEVTDSGEIDVIELQPFAETEPDEAPAPKAKAAARKPADKPKPKPAVRPVPELPADDEPEAVADEPESQPEETPDLDEAPSVAADAAPVAAAPAASEQDTLQQALARVQALVDQHRGKPGAGRKRTR